MVGVLLDSVGAWVGADGFEDAAENAGRRGVRRRVGRRGSSDRRSKKTEGAA